MGVESKKITFAGAHGDALAARLEMPRGAKPAGFAIFAHCFTCSKDLVAPARIARGLAARGIAVLRFDFTGLGHSEGEFANTNFSSNVEDLVRAADFLAEEYAAPSILIGHSFGGAAVLVAAARIDSVRAVATIGAPADPAHVEHLFGGKLSEIEAKGAAGVTIAGREFTVSAQFLEDIRQARMAQTLRELKKPLMIFHSPVDEVVSVENARLIYEAAKHPKSFISLDGAEHLLGDPADAAFVTDMLGAWAPRYVELPEAQSPWPDELGDPAPDEVLVQEASEGLYTNHVAVGRHHFFADEPVSMGGADAGPNPYDLLTAGLGACTSMTLRMYANHKGWPVEHVEVRLEHEKIHARDCDECAQQDGKIDQITRQILVKGELSEEQVARLLQIADRCPVHKTLHESTRILSEIVHAE